MRDNHHSFDARYSDTLENVLDRFERAWQSGSRPSIDDFLLGLPVTARQSLLKELVHIDLEYRLKAGEAARVEEYLASYSELAAQQNELLELIATEFALRKRISPGVSAA